MRGSILTNVNSVVSFLEDLKFPEIYNDTACTFAGQTIFDAVKVFDLEDIGKAFEELLIFKARACFVVLAEESQEVTYKGANQITQFKNHIALIYADRSYKNRQLSLVGDTTTPGVLMIQDILINELAGEPIDGMVCELGGGELFAIDGKDRDNTIGRIGWRQDVVLHSGRIVRQLSRETLKIYAPNGV
jgi:hypothetical protein